MPKFQPGDKVLVAIPSYYSASFTRSDVQGKVGTVEGAIITDQPSARIINGYKVKVGDKSVALLSFHLRPATQEEIANA